MQNRINLLDPSTSIKSKPASEGPSKVLVALCLISVVCCIGTYLYAFGMEKYTLGKVDRINKEIEGLQEVSQQLKTRGALAAEKSKSEKNIKLLNSERPKMSRYLAEVGEIIPAAVNLTHLQIKNEPFEVVLKGESPSHLDIARFGKNVQDSVYFKDGVISSSIKNNEQNTIEYSITVTPDKKGGNE